MYLFGAIVSLTLMLVTTTLYYLDNKEKPGFRKDNFFLPAIVLTVIGTALSWITIFVFTIIVLTKKLYKKYQNKEETTYEK